MIHFKHSWSRHCSEDEFIHEPWDCFCQRMFSCILQLNKRRVSRHSRMIDSYMMPNMDFCKGSSIESHKAYRTWKWLLACVNHVVGLQMAFILKLLSALITTEGSLLILNFEKFLHVSLYELVKSNHREMSWNTKESCTWMVYNRSLS